MIFSVVVPVYNVEKYITECLESILKQIPNSTNFCEVLLIDDGSTDSSGEICDYYEKMYPNIIKVFHNLNQGLLMTRRFGYKQSSGKYIINCDSDDTLEPDFFNSLTNTIDRYSEPDMILFNQNIYDGEIKKVAFKNVLSEEKICVIKKQDVLRKFLTDNSIVSLCGTVYKRKCIEINKDYSLYKRISNGEDSLQKIELFDNAESYVYLNKAMYNYRTGSGMTAKFDYNYYASFKVVLENILQRKEIWKLENFDELLGIKVLSITGRAITQSRLNKWKSYKEYKNYLKTIRSDFFVEKYIKYITKEKRRLQRTHIILIYLLKFKLYGCIIALLNVKNIIE